MSRLKIQTQAPASGPDLLYYKGTRLQKETAQRPSHRRTEGAWRFGQSHLHQNRATHPDSPIRSRRPSDRQQSLPLNTEHLGMRNGPGCIRTPAALLLLGVDATVSAPFPDSEFCLAQDQCGLLGTIPLPHLLPLDEHGQHGLDLLQPLLDVRHLCTSAFDAPILALLRRARRPIGVLM